MFIGEERFAPQRIEVERIKCPYDFPEIRRALREIGGLTKFGKQRLDIEFGGEATRPFGDTGMVNCKYGLYSEDVITGYRFSAYKGKFLSDGVRRSTKRDRMPLQTDIGDYDLIPDHIKKFSDGTLRICEPIISVIDHPVPNWFFVDYFSAAQCGTGRCSAGYEQGAWIRIWQCHDPSEAIAGPPFWGYRDPDALDLEVVKAYWDQRIRDVESSGCDIDDPAIGTAVELQWAWMDRAIKHLKEEERGKNAETFARYLEEYIDRRRAGDRPFVDLGATNVR